MAVVLSPVPAPRNGGCYHFATTWAIEAVDVLAPHGGPLAVGIDCQGVRRVAKLALDVGRGDALGDQDRGVGVPERVGREVLGQPRRPERPLERRADLVRIQNVALYVREDPARRVAPAPVQLLGLRLDLEMAERRDECPREIGCPRVSSLGSADAFALVGHRALDANLAPFEIEVAPPDRPRLPEPQASARQEEKERVVARRPTARSTGASA